MPVSPELTTLSARRTVTPGAHPDPNSPQYKATELRHPKQPLVIIPQTLTELSAPVYGHESVGVHDHDLTLAHEAPPLGQRIIVSGRVLNEDERPVPNTLIEVWQANAAGRYAHKVDQWNAPLDPNFTGAGRALTDADGQYRFVTIQPGAYPWRNHHNAWRPAHIHFSLFGQAFATRLVTQMYFPGDPLLPLDPIFNSVSDERARSRMVSTFDLTSTTPEWALGYRFDIVLRGQYKHRWNDDVAHLTPFQTVGPYMSIGLRYGLAGLPALQPESAIVIRGRLIDGAARGIPDGVVELWHPALPMIQRSLTAEDGSFAVETVKPPAIAGPGGRQQAPHFAVRVLGRGILTHYVTRLYFSDDAATAGNPILSLVPEHRRQTLIAQREASNAYRFDVILQGDNETVFFDI